MTKYYANMNVNNSTEYVKDIIDTNKERITKFIRKCANGYRFAGNECTWYVWNENGECVAAGYTLTNGVKCRVYGNDLHNYDKE